MRLLVLHNRYRLPGGEERVVQSEMDLLLSRGHEVRLLEVDNSEIEGRCSEVLAGLSSVYSRRSRRLVEQAITEYRPDLVHAHNLFPLLSVSVYDACRRAKVPVVQSLHNYRLACPSGLLSRDGRPCEDCVGKVLPWPSVIHRCYANSSLRSLAPAAMLLFNRLRGTWRKAVDAFIVLSEFQRSTLVAAGIPHNKLFLKPNFSRRMEATRWPSPGYFAFAGRLSREKGVETLLSGWRRTAGIPLRVAGEGPLSDYVAAEVARREDTIQWLGVLDADDIHSFLAGSICTVVPSNTSECFPLVVLESFAASRPVIAANVGSLAEIIDDGRTGILFEAGSPDDLARKSEWLWQNPQEAERMGRNAKAEYEAKYTPERNYEILSRIYRAVASDLTN